MGFHRIRVLIQNIFRSTHITEQHLLTLFPSILILNLYNLWGFLGSFGGVQIILLYITLYTVSFYKALWTSGYTSGGIGWGNLLAGECVTLLSNYAVTIIEES